MHVLLTPSWYPQSPSDFVGSFFREQAMALQESGLKVGVIAPQPLPLKGCIAGPHRKKGKVITDDQGVASYRHVYTNFCPLLPRLRGGVFCNYGMRLFKSYVADQGYPDIVHAHSALYGGELAMQIKKRFRIPYVLTEHSTAFAFGKTKHLEMLLTAQIIAEAGARIAVSPSLADSMKSLFPSDVDWQVIPNVVSKAFTDCALPQRYKNGSEFRFINLSAMNPRKGLALLLEAFAAALQENPNIRLTLAGSGPQEPDLKALATRLNLNAAVHFCGQLSRDRAVTALAAADALVISSRYETFGVTAIEAMALGKPIVSTRCGGPESVIDETNGILVGSESVGSLANGLVEMAKGTRDYDPIKLRELCLQSYGTQAICESLKTVFSVVLDRSAQKTDASRCQNAR